MSCLSHFLYANIMQLIVVFKIQRCINALKMADVHGKITFKSLTLCETMLEMPKSFKLGLEEA